MSAHGDSGSLSEIRREDGLYSTYLLCAGSARATLGILLAGVATEHGALTPL